MKRSVPLKRKTRLRPSSKWSCSHADKLFSRHIRARDGRCQYPNCPKGEPLDCSHFFERGYSGTRFDPDNCVALCRDHHTLWEHRKKYEYKEFMLARIGAERFAAMERRAYSYTKRSDAVAAAMAFLQA